MHGAYQRLHENHSLALEIGPTGVTEHLLIAEKTPHYPLVFLVQTHGQKRASGADRRTPHHCGSELSGSQYTSRLHPDHSLVGLCLRQRSELP